MDLSRIGHIAVIMDGNGRWARSRNLRRTFGHRAGVNAVRDCTTVCARAGLPWLTLYALSTENYRNRPRREIRVLMSLLRRYIIDERPTLMDNGVRLRTIGRVQELPDHVTEQIRITETMTAGNTGMVLALALNYGGHAEITDAVRALARKVRAGELDPDAIDESLIKANLYEPKMPPVDLLIRTGGEQRISNFLLWQVSYGELFVTPTLWPEFTEESLEEAVDVYWRRTRKFGGLLKGVDC